MSTITNTGFQRKRLDVILEELKESYRNIYGQDINLAADSLDGAWLGIIAERLSDLHQLAEATYNLFNPQFSTGAALSMLVALNKIRRQAGEYSTADVELRGLPNIVITAGSLIKSESNESTWQTMSDATLDVDGYALASVTCTVMGNKGAPPDTLTKIDTPRYGWRTVTNPSAALPGRAEETDEELRKRRKGSTSTAGVSVVDSMSGSIGNLQGVRKHRVFENYTDAVDTNGQPAHSIYAIVLGGDVAAIAETIYRKKTAGASLVGTIETPITGTNGFPQVIRFSRPTFKPAHVVVNVTRRAGYPIGGADKIKQAIANYVGTLDIGEPLDNSRIYTPANTIPNMYITSIYSGATPSPTTESNIVCDYDELITIELTNIRVVET